MATCSYDKSIMIWNSNDPYFCITSLYDNVDGVITMIQLKGKEILLTGTNVHLRVWNLKTYEDEITIKTQGSKRIHPLLEIDKGRVIVGGDNLVSILNTNKYVMENTFEK